jgi:hypothetical protein
MRLHSSPKPLAILSVQGNEGRSDVASCSSLRHQSKGRLARLALHAKQIVFVDRIGFGLEPRCRIAAAIDAVFALRDDALEPA